MFQAVPHPLLVYQHSPALIKRNLFLPRALQATDSSASLKNLGKPVFPSWPHPREAGERRGCERRAWHVLNSEVREWVEESRKEWSHRGAELRALTQLLGLGAWQVNQSCCSSLSSSTFQSLRSQEPRGWENLDITSLKGAELSRESSRNGKQFSKTRTTFPTINHKRAWSQACLLLVLKIFSLTVSLCPVNEGYLNPAWSLPEGAGREAEEENAIIPWWDLK